MQYFVFSIHPVLFLLFIFYYFWAKNNVVHIFLEMKDCYTVHDHRREKLCGGSIWDFAIGESSLDLPYGDKHLLNMLLR
jgi:hypothetical protein